MNTRNTKFEESTLEGEEWTGAGKVIISVIWVYLLHGFWMIEFRDRVLRSRLVFLCFSVSCYPGSRLWLVVPIIDDRFRFSFVPGIPQKNSSGIFLRFFIAKN